jgi:hypothetical protein
MEAKETKGEKGQWSECSDALLPMAMCGVCGGIVPVKEFLLECHNGFFGAPCSGSGADARNLKWAWPVKKDGETTYDESIWEDVL